MGNLEENKWIVYVHIVPKEISGCEWDKYYVGVTCQKVDRRWGSKSGVLYRKCRLFYEAIQQYGWDNIEHKIIAQCLFEDEAYRLEKQLIKTLKSNDEQYGYNLTSGGKGAPSIKPHKIVEYSKDNAKQTDFVNTELNNTLFYIKNTNDFATLEEWRAVVGYEGYYEVSNFGRVRSLDRWVSHGRWGNDSLALKKGKILIEKDNGYGYKTVPLTLNRNTKSYYVHRLVAMAFIENPNNLSEVNHKDENTSNNCVDNLEWCTQKYNNNYGSHKRSISKPVAMFTYDGKYIDEFISAAEAERTIGLTGISSACRDGRRRIGGYLWRYKEDLGENYKNDLILKEGVDYDNENCPRCWTFSI